MMPGTVQIELKFKMDLIKILIKLKFQIKALSISVVEISKTGKLKFGRIVQSFCLLK